LPAEDRPLRLLLIRSKPGEMPWFAHTVSHMMAPVEIVQVVGMGNALWRLGHERFDSVLLDVDLVDRQVIRRCREQIADIAAVPVLDLADPPAALQFKGAGGQQRRQAETMVRETERQTLRLPWQRRSKRAAAQQAAAVG
jgi:hypothetical protein